MLLVALSAILFLHGEKTWQRRPGDRKGCQA
jgi:hypothetical protein